MGIIGDPITLQGKEIKNSEACKNHKPRKEAGPNYATGSPDIYIYIYICVCTCMCLCYVDVCSL